jgi:hypothetical protein
LLSLSVLVTYQQLRIFGNKKGDCFQIIGYI